MPPAITQAAADWAEGRGFKTARPRALRPLALLQHFENVRDQPAWRVMLGAMRKGWLGR